MGIIVLQQGTGGFLRPPSHPEHTCCICIDGQNRSLSSALYHNNVAARIIARKIIERWYASALEIDVDWVRRVLGYYQHAWRNPRLKEPECWFVSNIFYCVDPLGASFLDHYGVHHIQKFYPDYFPTQEDFDAAYWDGQTSFEVDGLEIRDSVMYNAENEVFEPPILEDESDFDIPVYDITNHLPAAIADNIPKLEVIQNLP